MYKAIKFVDAIKYAKDCGSYLPELINLLEHAKDIAEYNRINELKQSSIIKYSENK